MYGLYDGMTIFNDEAAAAVGATLVLNDPKAMCCGETICVCPSNHSKGEQMFVINPNQFFKAPERQPAPAGFVDYVVNENDVLVAPESFPDETLICVQCNGVGKTPNEAGTELTNTCVLCEGTGKAKIKGAQDVGTKGIESVGNVAADGVDEDDVLVAPVNKW